jgi:hypothetical protein
MNRELQCGFDLVHPFIHSITIVFATRTHGNDLCQFFERRKSSLQATLGVVKVIVICRAIEKRHVRAVEKLGVKFANPVAFERERRNTPNCRGHRPILLIFSER